MSNGLWTRPLPGPDLRGPDLRGPDLLGPDLPGPAAPADVVVTPVRREDLDAVGAAYWAASPAGTMADVAEAVADVRAAWDGEYGTWLPRASLLARDGDDQVVAVVETTLDVPWRDCPRGPFLIDLFTVPQHRGRGLARHLVARALAALVQDGHRQVGLRVEDDNAAARRLYAGLGFREASPV